MPPKPLRKCKAPACGNLTRERYCEDHEHLIEKDKRDKWIQYDKNIRNSGENKNFVVFYSSKEWKQARMMALRRDNFLCQHCIKNNIIRKADMVHHIVEVKIAWHLRLYQDNLISLCNPCHSKVHSKG